MNMMMLLYMMHSDVDSFAKKTISNKPQLNTAGVGNSFVAECLTPHFGVTGVLNILVLYFA